MNPVTAYRFITSKQFAVVGASTDRSKYGNRVLRWYQGHELPVIPVNHKEAEVESLRAVGSLREVSDPAETGLSIITPPKVTLDILKLGKELGFTRFWLQPGAEDKAVLDYAKEADLDIIAGGPCILVQGPGLLTHRSKI